jgi:ribonuclease E
VQLYRDPTPLFHRHQVESQLDAIHNPVVQLKSGGYIVINSTEALVAIDVNSGRATRERNIEETAYKTNLEAAEEIARQLRLRDLAGLIVIDFIDMEESRHNAAVERKLKEAMRHDRARIQIGRISAFGLLELSRQRMRPSLFETSTEICQHCRGTGHVRSTESTVLHVLRSIEDECLKSRAAAGLSVAVPTAVALYILNHKRKALAEIELRHGMRIFITGDDHLIPPEYRVERIKALAPSEQVRPAVMQEIAGPVSDEAEEIEAAEEDEDDEEEAEAVAEGRSEGRAEGGAERDAGGEDRRHKRSRRRRRGRDRDHEGDRDRGHDRGRGAPGTPREAPGDVEPRIAPQIASGTEDVAEATGGAAEAPRPAAEDGGAEEPRRRRRRGRRGGRRRRRPGEGPGEAMAEGAASAGDDGLDGDDEAAESAESEADADGVFAEAGAEPEAAPKPGRRRRRGRRPGAAKDDMGASGEDAEVTADESAEPAPMAAAVEAEPHQEPEFEPAAKPWRTVETVEPLAAAPAETRSSEWPRREPQESVPVAAAPAPAVEAPAVEAPAIQAPAAEPAPAGPPRKGWWRRLAE